MVVKARWLERKRLMRGAIWLLVVLFLVTASSAKTPLIRGSLVTDVNSPGVKIHVNDDEKVGIDNGLVNVTLAKPGGDVTAIQYNGITDNVLEIVNEEDDRGYWDVVWYKPGGENIIDKLQATAFSVVREDEDQVEVSFTKNWDASLGDSVVPLNVDKRYVIRRGQPGIYLYTILERLERWPDVDMDQIRVVFKLQKAKFHYMAISDERQREMPMPEDRATGQPLAYPEAVLLTSPINPQLKGEVDDKYQYSSEDKDNKVYGWISEDPPVGFWMITPSNEFRCGGPNKQDLTSHVGPVVLNMFTSTHYTGKDLDTAYRNGEPWKKVFGPAYVYLNSAPGNGDKKALWEDAKEQMSTEEKAWPYDFIQSEDFPPAAQRGTVTGQLKVSDWYVSEELTDAGFAFVGLAAPGEVGSWQTEAKGYQFWTQANSEGEFVITNVRAGDYDLYAWVPGVIGDYKYSETITIRPGSNIQLDCLVYEPPRNGPTLWEIGIPDRSAAEFFIPSPDPTLINKLYTNTPTDKFRQYGLWDQYTKLFPDEDLIFTVGLSNYRKDWFYAHVNRDGGDHKTYRPTTWQVIFELDSLPQNGDYTLQLALASATSCEIKVGFNNPGVDRPIFTTGVIGKDNAVARHGIHGLYWLYSIGVPSNELVKGKNTMYLTQTRALGPFYSVMYDYIRLEGPDLLNVR